MPEQPEGKLHFVAVEPPTSVAACEVAGAEMGVTSNFSFLRGASHPDELVYQAAILGYRAVAITDRNSVAGVVRAYEAAKKCQMKLVVGARLELVDGPEVLVWAGEREGYADLCRILTTGRRRA